MPGAVAAASGPSHCTLAAVTCLLAAVTCLLAAVTFAVSTLARPGLTPSMIMSASIHDCKLRMWTSRGTTSPASKRRCLLTGSAHLAKSIPSSAGSVINTLGRVLLCPSSSLLYSTVDTSCKLIRFLIVALIIKLAVG